jgi:hypothetical protein
LEGDAKRERDEAVVREVAADKADKPFRFVLNNPKP